MEARALIELGNNLVLGQGKIDTACRALSLKKNSQKSAPSFDCTHNHQLLNELLVCTTKVMAFRQ
jgi:hypothetical protein